MSAARRLSDPHLAHLRTSGLTDDTIAAMGVFTETNPRRIAVDFLGWKGPPPKKSGWSGWGPSIVFPLLDPDGWKVVAHRIRPDNPRPDTDDKGAPRKNGKAHKYEGPKAGFGRLAFELYVYRPAFEAGWFADVARPLLLTEGEKKGALLCQLGFAAIAATGVDNFHDPEVRDRENRFELHRTFRHVAIAGRRCVLVPDADVADPSKPDIGRAMQRLAAMLYAAGAAEVVLGAPPWDEGRAPKGIDDLFVAEGREAVERVIASAAAIANDPALLAAGSKPPKWLKELARSEKGEILKTSTNVVRILRHDERWRGVIGYDQRADAILFRKPPPQAKLLEHVEATPRNVRDSDAIRIAAWIEVEFGVSIHQKSVNEAIDVIASENAFDPVRERLESFTWDRTPRVDGWLARYLGATDDAYTRGVGARWMISAVARAFRPGCQADHALVLEGPQAIGKSSALRLLALEPRWFADEVGNMATKDAAEILRGPWIVELAELDALTRSEVSTVKAYLTRVVDRYRPAYARRADDFPRRVVFAGTTNESGYLKDATGARRFWPVRCGTIDRAALEVDREQLWAEAVHRFKAGEAWHPDAELVAHAATATEDRYEVDPWEGMIGGFVESRAEVTVRELAKHLGVPPERHDQRTEKRIVRALKRLGWTSTSNPCFRVLPEVGRVRVRVYTPKADSTAATSGPRQVELDPRDEWGAS